MRGRLDLSILLLTEDGAKDAHETLAAVVKRTLVFIDGGCGTHRVDIIEPQQSDRDVMKGNQWRSRRTKMPGLRAKIILLGRHIAEKLLEGLDDGAGQPPGFVFFHFDGDCKWSERRHAEDDKREDFDEFVRRFVTEHLKTARHGRSEDLKRALGRLKRLVPFHSIEAWLYQNITEARRLCRESCGRHLELLDEWEAARSMLDEIEQPKSALCLGADRDRSHHNLALARNGFPADAAFGAATSYAAAVMDLLECRDLCAALARTYTA